MVIIMSDAYTVNVF